MAQSSTTQSTNQSQNAADVISATMKKPLSPTSKLAYRLTFDGANIAGITNPVVSTSLPEETEKERYTRNLAYRLSSKGGKLSKKKKNVKTNKKKNKGFGAKPLYWIQIIYANYDKEDTWIGSWDDYPTTVEKAASFLANPEYLHMQTIFLIDGSVKIDGYVPDELLLGRIDRPGSLSEKELEESINLENVDIENEWMGVEKGDVKPKIVKPVRRPVSAETEEPRKVGGNPPPPPSQNLKTVKVYPSPFPQPNADGTLCPNCKPTPEQLEAL